MTQTGKTAIVDLNQLSQSPKDVFLSLMPLAEICEGQGQSPWYM